MEKMFIEFMTLDDGYKTTQGTAYIDGKFFVTKRGRGEFDVLNKIAKFYTDSVIESLGITDLEGQALEEHIARMIAKQEEN